MHTQSYAIYSKFADRWEMVGKGATKAQAIRDATLAGGRMSDIKDGIKSGSLRLVPHIEISIAPVGRRL